MKSTDRLAPVAVDRDPDPDHLAGVGRVFIFGAVGQALEHAAHAFGGIVLDMAHIGLDHVEPEMRDHLLQFRHALFVGGDLRLEVGDVLLRVARRPGVVGQKLVQLGLAEFSALDEAEIVDQHALLVDRRRERRHRARGGAADVGMVAARGDPEQDLFRGLIKHRRHHRDVGQMGAAIIRSVQRKDVAGMDVALVEPDDRLDGPVHRAEMHRHVRRVGDERAVAVEHGAGEVEPLLDVDRIGGVLQRHPHLLGNRHEQVVEDLEHDRVGGGAEGCRARAFRSTRRISTWFLARDLGLPAGLDDDGLVALDDEGGPGDLVARLQRLAAEDARLAPGALGEDLSHLAKRLAGVSSSAASLSLRPRAPPSWPSSATASTTTGLSS